jgi:monoamine oxidase
MEPSKSSLTGTAPKKRPSGRIVVVGAGLAGLCAAFELQRYGYGVTLYEASDHLGGRVRTLDGFVPGKKAEGGGELIGSNHPLWNAYANLFGLTFSAVAEYGSSLIRVMGKTLSFEESSALLDDMEEQQKALEAMAAKIIDPYEPWINRDAAQLDGLSLRNWMDGLTGCSPECKEAFAEMMAADNGIPADQQSLLGVLAMIKGGGLHQYWTDTEVYRCKEGSQELARMFERELNRTKPDTVRLNEPVESIDNQNGKVVLKLGGSGSREVSIDPPVDVILAIPPSVWNKIIFPDPVLAGILHGGPALGTTVKYLIGLKDRFWKPLGTSPSLTEDGPVNITWETTEADTRGDFVMVAFSGSDDAKTCASWDERNRRSNYVQALATVYPGIDSEITKTEFINWPNEEWAKASYYFPRVNEVTVWGPFWKSGYKGWLHFAGEHTCYAFVGYMEGALSSGYRLARRLAVRDGLFPG